jgi:hypothetical protein
MPLVDILHLNGLQLCRRVSLYGSHSLGSVDVGLLSTEQSQEPTLSSLCVMIAVSLLLLKESKGKEREALRCIFTNI